MSGFETEILSEAKIVADINEFFVVSDLNELFSEEEVSDCLDAVSRYSKLYRDIHTELKFKLKEAYTEKYTEYDEIANTLRNYIKDAKKKYRLLKKEIEQKRQNELTRLKLEEKEQYKASLMSEHEFFLSKLKRKLDSCDWNAINDPCDVTSGVQSLELALDEWYSLHGKLHGVFSEGYEKTFQEIFQENVTSVVAKVNDGKLKIKELTNFRKQEVRKAEELRFQEEQEKSRDEKDRLDSEANVRLAENQNFAESLYDEIIVLDSNLHSKSSIDLKGFGDHHLLDLKKNIAHLTFDLHEILNKITSFSKLVPHCGKKGLKMMSDLSEIRSKSAASVTKYSNELGYLLRERDICDEKLKSAHNLKVELPKFRGYDSELNIYSFRTEFEKLLQPVVQKAYWVDYLKRNYLAGNALILVDKLDNIDEIWKRLVSSYGNMRLLLQNKISSVEKQTGIWKLSSDEKIGMALAALIDLMIELTSMAKTFELEEELYYGGCLEKIMSLLGNKLERKFVSKCESQNAKKPAEWIRLKNFLESELAVSERLVLLNKSKKCLGIESKTVQSIKPKSVNTSTIDARNKCFICDNYDHITVPNSSGRSDVPYYVCKKFVEMTADDRRKLLYKKKLCARCLEPGMKFNETQECSKEYECPDNFHKNFKKGLHVLVCANHKSSAENVNLLKKFRSSISKIQNLEKLSKEISISYSQNFQNVDSENDCSEHAIFMLQTINVDNHLVNIFYDSGCADMVIKKSAVDILLKLGRANLVDPGPIHLSGVGGQKSICEHGEYSVRLPLKSGEEANISGLCLDQVTSEFPRYPLRKVTGQLRNLCKNEGNESLSKTFPKMPKEVGGVTDILLGIKYVKYFPELVHMFPSGLSVYRSIFLSSDGSDGVFGGPHPEFSKAEKAHRAHTGTQAYFLPTAETYKSMCKLQSEVPLLGNKQTRFCSGEDFVFEPFLIDTCICRKQLKCARQFEEVENAGTEVSYRCIDCRNCPECKKSPRIEDISIQEEVEQSLIDRSVSVDIDKRLTTASLPFLNNPDIKLVPNEKSALKIYKAQVRKLETKPEDKAAKIFLHDLGFVDFFDNLTSEEKLLFENKLQNYIPWRVTWNLNSPTTIVRLVFDASHTSPGGCSLNSILAKGINSMNLLISILIRWTTYKFAFHTDIQKMYNAVSLQKEHWRYQMYWWSDDLSVERPPQRKVIKTLIYGVKPSGNLAERALRQTAEKTKHLYPRACEIINEDMYVDDCLSGENSLNDRLKSTDNLKLALEMGGFTPKGFIFSGNNPPDQLSKDGLSVTVGGLKWFPKGDFISINIGDLNFAKKNRGRKLNSKSGIIPDNLTKRDCVGKVGEIFDPLGKLTPLVAGMKLDIHELHARKLDWDDKIPDDLRKIWLSNFEVIQEIKDIRFNRAVIPIDALSLDMETIDTADAGGEPGNQLTCCFSG